MFSIFKNLIGTANDRIIKKLRAEILKINQLENEFEQLSDKELQNKTSEFKRRLQAGATLDSLIYEAFATAREASKRIIGKRHYDVQLIGGLIMHRGMIAEMRTGEGKTLVAVLPAYLNSLTGRGVHIVTVNDYLVQRDSKWMGQIYEFLGVSVGYIVNNMTDEMRRLEYKKDIVHTTNNELGFDFLRDNMKYSEGSKVLRPFNFAIIDEVDSILIDEARTPLVISGPVNDNSKLYHEINALITKLVESDYEQDEKLRTVNLTESGINKIESMLCSCGLINNDSGLYDFENLNLVHYVNQSLKAHVIFHKDVDYIVQDHKIMIIDELTGRIMDGRRYSEGLHQALEAKESLKIQNENQTLASITFQNYFRLYPKLSGMTGTAMTEAAELKDIYNLEVVAVPTHHPVQRVDYDDEIYGSKHDKYNAILALIVNCYDKGQPVLVGTISIEKSEELSAILNKHKIKHNILNAKFHEQEASIIAQAGRSNAVTIATNMAGRGTDIMLGGNAEMLISKIDQTNLTNAEYETTVKNIIKQVEDDKQKVIESGGLFIIGTERHESRRIDNQLRGRAGRQGDPGATKFFLSLEDDLMRIFASDRTSGILRTLGLKNGEAIHHPMISRSLEKAQQKVESHNYEIRKNLLRFDDVMNDQRKIIYEQRVEIIASKDANHFLESMTEDMIKDTVLSFMTPESYKDDWDLHALANEILRIFSIQLDLSSFANNDESAETVVKSVTEMVYNLFAQKRANYTTDVMNDAVKYILLTTLDQVWKDHLHNLDYLRQGISLRAYGQKDPLSEYKREAFGLFKNMLTCLKELFVQKVCYLHIDTQHIDRCSMSLANKQLQQMSRTREDPAFSKYNAGKSIETSLKPVKSYVAPKNRIDTDPTSWGKISRNEPCPCNSGKKYKHCHGSA